MKPTIKFLAEMANNVFMTKEELAERLKDRDHLKDLVLSQQDSKVLNQFLSNNKASVTRRRADAIRVAVRPI